MPVEFQGLFFPLPLRSITGVSLVNPAVWYAIGDPLERPARILKWDNLSDRAILISTNGVEAFTIIPAGGFMLLDVSTNSTKVCDYLVNEGMQFWASASSAPTTGSLYLTAIGSRDY